MGHDKKIFGFESVKKVQKMPILAFQSRGGIEHQILGENLIY